MNFQEFYFTEGNIIDGFEFLDNGGILIRNVSTIPKQVLSKINTYMKRKGYDWMGVEDTRNILKRMEGKTITIGGLKDHYEAIKQATKPKKELSLDEKVLKAVRRKFGLTNNVNLAGYIMNDGKFLDMSGARFGAWNPKTREMDHREIGKALENIDHPAAKGGSDGMMAFMKLGPIRIDGNSGLIDIATKPTKQQKLAIMRFIEQSKADYVLLEMEGMGESFYEEYDKPVRKFEISQKIDMYYAGKLGKENKSNISKFR